MSISSFLKEQLEKKEHSGQSTEKENFREKCLAILQQIKTLNEERYQELNRIFHQGHDKIHVQKKKILGFHGQLVNELKTLREAAGMAITETQKQVHSGAKNLKDEVQKTTKKVANQLAHEVKNKVEGAVHDTTTSVKKTVKGVVKEAEKNIEKIKKIAEKAPSKLAKATQQAAPPAKTGQAGKTAKKVTKTAAKSTTAASSKKAPSKKVVKKSTSKK